VKEWKPKQYAGRFLGGLPVSLDPELRRKDVIVPDGVSISSPLLRQASEGWQSVSVFFTPESNSLSFSSKFRISCSPSPFVAEDSFGGLCASVDKHSKEGPASGETYTFVIVVAFVLVKLLLKNVQRKKFSNS